MKLLTEFLPHLLFCGFIFIACMFGFVVLVWAFGLTVLPLHWVITKFTDTRCPECKGFFKRKLMNLEVTDEREVLRTIVRVDEGVAYSNHFLEPNQVIEINRKEQVTFVEKTILNHWGCKNPLCGHQWQTEEFSEYEGSLVS
jgi:hypothetical protein